MVLMLGKELRDMLLLMSVRPPLTVPCPRPSSPLCFSSNLGCLEPFLLPGKAFLQALRPSSRGYPCSLQAASDVNMQNARPERKRVTSKSPANHNNLNNLPLFRQHQYKRSLCP